MRHQEETGDKTENATPKRLRDARRKGDVPKSKDVSSTLGLAFAAAVLWFAFEASLSQLVELLSAALLISDTPFSASLSLLGSQAVTVFLSISATILIPIALFGMLVEFLQTGPVFALEKVVPKLSHLNPTSGFKRLFSSDNLVELVKSITKTVLLFIICYFVVRQFLAALMLIPGDQTISIALAMKTLLSSLVVWTLGIFAGIMVLDFVHQRYAYAKKMRMSISEIKQEQKDTEGDPALSQQRRQMHQEFSEQSMTDAARSATALVVNPTHVAIAIHYDRHDSPVPVITAKGEDETARKMREAANQNHVPVLRNELLARTLLANADEGDAIPREMFDIVAQIILWATKTSALVAQQLGDIPAYTTLEQPPEPPGENLTVYPVGFGLMNIFSAPTEPVTTSDVNR